MPYHISQSDSWQDGQRYEIAIVDELDAATARSLGDWLAVARLNPEATFALDLSRASGVDGRALARLLTRHEELTAERRLELAGGERTRRLPTRALALPAYVPVLDALLTSVG
jgi:hypothetical protein